MSPDDDASAPAADDAQQRRGRPSRDMAMVSFWAAASDRTRAQQLADARGVSLSALLREALASGLDSLAPGAPGRDA